MKAPQTERWQGLTQFLLGVTALAAWAGCSGQVGLAADPSGSGSQAGSTGPNGSTSSGPAGGGSGGVSSTSGAGVSGAGAAIPGTMSTSGAASTGAIAPKLPMAPDGGVEGLPCDVNQLLVTRCQSCHSSPPVAPSPMSLVTYANLIAPALIDMTKTYAQESVLRMQNTGMPMPPAPATRATAA